MTTNTEIVISNSQKEIDHANSISLRFAVLSLMDEMDPDVYENAIWWAAYGLNYGQTMDEAAYFGVVQATL